MNQFVEEMCIRDRFNSFNTSEELRSKLGTFSPLLSPFGEYAASPSAQILAYQKIGQVDTEFPLILMGETNDILSLIHI